MRYMLLIYGDEQAWSDEERERCYGESAAFARELEAGGRYLAAPRSIRWQRPPASASATASGS